LEDLEERMPFETVGTMADQAQKASVGTPCYAQTASVIIPTRNAEPHLPALIASLAAMTNAPRRVLFIDSQSSDRTQAMVKQAGHALEVINPHDFGHGRTRNIALTLCSDSRHIVFLTQDAIPLGADWLDRLLSPFARADVAVSFGRQLARPNASLPERFARAFNYRETDDVTTEADIARRGIKAVFCSNSFAAYDRGRLESIGGFPDALPLGEDMAAALRLLRSGYARAYCASAMAIHSHNYTVWQEFRRYFDIGVLLECDQELQRARLTANGEGRSMLEAEMRYAWTEGGVPAIAAVLGHAIGKLAGFKLGGHYRNFPRSLCRRMSMHSYYWVGL
jgi:rhamnosyltransferase